MFPGLINAERDRWTAARFRVRILGDHLVWLWGAHIPSHEEQVTREPQDMN